ncbi:pentapeptide repeat-containing protein [Leucobacter allii]|uniref:pentapeptide repeat-containing protein n=1 Tax=Leucobacter allii TaxID=2932247 RepID=UPI001FD1F284|nr:pentapeptide repeat-containing protein [Leucobacter allii]UOR00683.1 pentapeptide repeat-containing protein [Leucobacter allii]
MTPQTKRRLRDRWTPERTASIERELVLAARRPGASAPTSPFGTTGGGRIDLRGIRLTTPIRWQHAIGVDLSDAVFADGASVNESELEDCVLDRIDMRGVFVRRRFVDCSFAGAKLSGARLGGTFIGCDFSGATLSRSVASGVRFERCTFTGATLRAVQWTSRCVFDHCVFDGVAALTGSVAGGVFIGATPPELDGCIVDHVRFEAG